MKHKPLYNKSHFFYIVSVLSPQLGKQVSARPWGQIDVRLINLFSTFNRGIKENIRISFREIDKYK